MSHYDVASLFGFAGALVALLPGRIFGQVVFEQDERDFPSMPATVAAFVAVIGACLGHYMFGARGLLSIVLALPAFFLADKLLLFATYELVLGAAKSHQGLPESRRQTNLSNFRASGLGCGAIGAFYICDWIAATHGTMVAVLSLVFVAPLSVIPSLGALFVFMGAINTAIAVVMRLSRKLRKPAHKIGGLRGN